MGNPLLPDTLWQMVEPLLPPKPPRGSGRPPVRDRSVLAGILFVLRSGIPWEDLPDEMGCGSGMTCLRRLREWQRVGVWENMQSVLQAHWPDARRADWSRVYVTRTRTSSRRHDLPTESVPPS